MRGNPRVGAKVLYYFSPKKKKKKEYYVIKTSHLVKKSKKVKTNKPLWIEIILTKGKLPCVSDPE